MLIHGSSQMNVTARPSSLRFLRALRGLRGVITSFEGKIIFHHEKEKGPRRQKVWIENQTIASDAFPSRFSAFQLTTVGKEFRLNF
jgi:hypothetical protein